MLCDDCSGFSKSLSPEYVRHKRSPLVLELSSDGGCHLCKIISRRLFRYYEELRRREREYPKKQKADDNLSDSPPNKQVWLRASYSNGEAKTDPYQPLPDGFTKVTNELSLNAIEVHVGEDVVEGEWIEIGMTHHFSGTYHHYLDVCESP